MDFVCRKSAPGRCHRQDADATDQPLFVRFRQANIDRRSVAVNAGDGNLSAMSFHHRARDGEPETGPACLPVRYEGLESLGNISGGMPTPVSEMRSTT